MIYFRIYKKVKIGISKFRKSIRISDTYLCIKEKKHKRQVITKIKHLEKHHKKKIDRRHFSLMHKICTHTHTYKHKRKQNALKIIKKDEC